MVELQIIKTLLLNDSAHVVLYRGMQVILLKLWISNNVLKDLLDAETVGVEIR
jgi:hypothetical protein